MILKSLGIAIKQVDISAPGMDEQRDFMRASAKKKEGQRHALPPQIFNGEKYCGVSYNLGKNFINFAHFRIMMTLMLLMKMMNWRSFWAFQEKHQR